MSIEIKGLDEIISKLDKLQSGNALSKSTFDGIGNMIADSIENAFEDERSPFGEKWKPLSATTVFSEFGGGGLKGIKSGTQDAYTKNGKRQRKRFLDKFGAGGTRKILQQKGNLAHNWHINATKTSVTVSNNSSADRYPYGLTHQFGTNKAGKHKNVHIPARPFLPVDSNGELEPNLKENIKSFLNDEIAKVFKNN